MALTTHADSFNHYWWFTTGRALSENNTTLTFHNSIQLSIKFTLSLNNFNDFFSKGMHFKTRKSQRCAHCSESVESTLSEQCAHRWDFLVLLWFHDLFEKLISSRNNIKKKWSTFITSSSFDKLPPLLELPSPSPSLVDIGAEVQKLFKQFFFKPDPLPNAGVGVVRLYWVRGLSRFSFFETWNTILYWTGKKMASLNLVRTKVMRTIQLKNAIRETIAKYDLTLDLQLCLICLCSLCYSLWQNCWIGDLT